MIRETRMSGAVRASVSPVSRLDGDPVIVVGRSDEGVVVDGQVSTVGLRPIDELHVVLDDPTLGVQPEEPAAAPSDDRVHPVPVVLGSPRHTGEGVDLREVLVDGWRVEVAIEPEARAALRERARRGGSGAAAGGPVDVRAIIPGRIVALDVAPGDGVTAGQQLLVLEAMKMQNELRAPRDGTIERVAVTVGVTVDVGDLLLVLR